MDCLRCKQPNSHCVHICMYKVNMGGLEPGHSYVLLVCMYKQDVLNKPERLYQTIFISTPFTCTVTIFIDQVMLT